MAPGTSATEVLSRFAAIIAILTLAATAHAQDFQYAVLAGPGHTASVPPTLSSATAIDISDAGHILFIADGALVRWTENGTTVIAMPGDAAPGGGIFSSLFGASMNGRGDVVFAASLSGRDNGVATSSGMFLFVDGRLESVLEPGTPAPWGGTFRSFDLPAINVSGEVAFIGSLAIR